MTQDQEEHLVHVESVFLSLCEKKYRKGQAEHGGNLVNLSKLDLVEAALEEAIDQVVYLVTLRDKMKNETLNSDTINSSR